MRVDRDAAAIVAHRQTACRARLGLQRDLDARGVAGDGFVHAVVDDFGGKMVERTLIGAADIHAGAAPDRLQPLEHLDRRGIIAIGGGGAATGKKVGHEAKAIRRRFAPCQAIGCADGGLSPQ